jgi:hypothetical protein
MEYVSEEKMKAIFDEIDEMVRVQQEAFRSKQALTHQPWSFSDSDSYSCIAKAASCLKRNYIFNNLKIVGDADQRLIQERAKLDEENP